MKTKTTPQKSFLDVDYYCEGLIPKHSYYRRFRKTLGPLINDEMFSDLYCGKNGRPPISPSLLAKAMLLQFHRNLSDRQMERACMFDIEIKYALGLRVDERPFDHSSLGDFRKRLLASDRSKQVFDDLLDLLVKKRLIRKNGVQRIDATHVIADIAIPNMVGMVKKGIYEVLKPLKKHHLGSYNRVTYKIDMEKYSKFRVNDEGPGRFSLENRANYLLGIVDEAKTVLDELKFLEEDKRFKTQIGNLKTILRENIEESENGTIREMLTSKKPTNRMVSPIDTDARAGAKSKFKKFIGYKTSITQEVDNQFITNVDVMPGNKRDGDPMVELVEEQILKRRVKPKKLIGDTAYGDGKNRHELRQLGTDVISPFKEKNPRTKAVFLKSMFKINRRHQTLTCPMGVIAKPHYYESQQRSLSYHFPMSACNKCEWQSECTKSKEGRRTVKIFDWQEETNKSQEYNLTSEFKEDMRLRQPVEGKFAEMKRYHGLTRTRYRGLEKVRLQSYFTAAVVNIKRWFRIEYGATEAI